MYRSAMVIDDSMLERFLADAMIKRYQFAEEVISFNGPADGLAYLRTLEAIPDKLPDLIFVDIHMPVMTGFDFLDQFLKLPDAIQAKCKVVMFSSTKSDEDFVRMKKYPVIRRFLTKPLTEDALNEIRSL